MKTPQQKSRRAVTGRRAVESPGRLLSVVKTEVPRVAIFQSCKVCERDTNSAASADGSHYCRRHRHIPNRSGPKVKASGPKKREYAGEGSITLARGMVWRLCVRCDGKLQKSPNAVGPFMCQWCKREYWKAKCRTGKIHEIENTQTDPRKERRIVLLAEMYAAAERSGSPEAMRAAGKPTTAADLEFESEHYDPLASASADDAEAEEEDAG